MEIKLTSERPPGWNYNPSSWPQRWPLIVVAIVGFCIAMYLGAFQLGWIDRVWDPFFGKGSEKVLTSFISKALPVPDALLGAFGYVLDAVTGAIGGVQRWKRMPWIVILFGLAVGPLGLVSIFLVVAQPVLLQQWCTLCLCSALISVLMISPATDEVLASLQYLKRVKQQGYSWWQAFWGSKSISENVS